MTSCEGFRSLTEVFSGGGGRLSLNSRRSSCAKLDAKNNGLSRISDSAVEICRSGRLILSGLKDYLMVGDTEQLF